MKRCLISFSLLSAVAAPSVAGELDTINLLTQSEFRLLSEDLGSALSYKATRGSSPPRRLASSDSTSASQ